MSLATDQCPCRDRGLLQEYDLRNKVDATGNLHCEVRRGMYGLPQAGIIAQELLQERLLKAGYHQSKVKEEL